MRNIRIVAGIALAITFIGLASCKSEKADIVINGRIITFDEEMPEARSLAIKDGKIVFIGENSRKFIGENTEVIDTEGLVTPGFTIGNVYGCSALWFYDSIREIPQDSLEKFASRFPVDTCCNDTVKTAYILSLQNHLLKNGITAFLDPRINYPALNLCDMYESMDRQGLLKIRTFGGWRVENDMTYGSVDSLSSLSAKCRGGRFEMNTLTLVSDSLWRERSLANLINKANESGMNVLANANDAESMKNFIVAVDSRGKSSSRNALVYDGPFSEEDNSIISSNRIVKATGSLFPIVRNAGILPIVADLVNGENGMKIMDALELYTVKGSYQFGIEDVCGALAVGKEADITIIGKDITKTGADDIVTASVDCTIIAGEIAYRRSDAI